jgi:poly-gamma-glutamate capsule biosynthesis protein CapA/YwtB (metallophosphatase superfamily)
LLVGWSSHEKTPLVFQRHGLRIAVLSYNEFHPRSFEAGHNTPGVAWSEDQQVEADITAARKLHRADVVIPIMHWGWENERQASDFQRWQLCHEKKPTMNFSVKLGC